jgi:type III pantothenate kinase
MILLLEIGNTTLKWASWEAGRLGVVTAMPWRGRELAQLAGEQWSKLAPPQRMLVASVAPAEVAAGLGAWTRSTWDVVPETLAAVAHAGGVVNGYVEPDRLGVDRWLGLVAARSLVTGPACMIDCGTALTVDVLDGNGQHLGGLIVPGLGLMRTVLEQNTGIRLGGDGLGSIELLARDTDSAVNGGTLYATVAFIDRVVADVAAALGVTPQCLITGGDAPHVLPLLADAHQHRPDLVIEGMGVLLEEAS